MNKIFIKPKEGLFVRNPFTKKLIAPAGETVGEHTYWLRLQKQGDVTISEAKEEKRSK